MKHTTIVLVFILLFSAALIHGLDLIVPETFSSASSAMECMDKCVSWRDVKGKMRICIKKEQFCDQSKIPDRNPELITMRMLTM